MTSSWTPWPPDWRNFEMPTATADDAELDGQVGEGPELGRGAAPAQIPAFGMSSKYIQHSANTAMNSTTMATMSSRSIDPLDTTRATFTNASPT